jgi:hypothetical protein
VTKKTLLVFTVICVLFPALSLAMEYQHKLEAKNMEIFWTIDRELIHVKLVAGTTGWVAIGFDPEKGMQGANIVIGAVENGQVRIEDHYGDRKRAHSTDERLGGENHVLNPGGEEVDGVTTIFFSLVLESLDKWDKSIHPQGISRIMVAHGGKKDSFKSGHRYRGIYDINFTTGKTKKIK